MLNKILKGTGLLIACSLFSTSCIGNFEELNTHPTDLNPDWMTPIEKVGSLFPTMLDLLHPANENKNQHIEQMVAGQYGGYFTTTNPWQDTNFGTFNPSGLWVEEPYKLLFTNFYPNYLTIKEATGGTGYMFAWANIVRVGVMLTVTDMYGPIPYSKMGEGSFQVPYDNVQDIYHGMMQDLTNSVNELAVFLKENQNTVLPIAEYDVIYNGDFNKWIKYANSLKFRMAVRIAHLDTDFAKRAMKEALEGGMIESNTDNAFLPTNDNPICKSANEWGDVAINASLSAYMSGYEDPRLEYYMTKTTDGTYCGVRMGINKINKSIYSSARFSKPVYKQNSALPIYYAAETYFLKAEAALQGWIDGGEEAARTYYEQGITTSMQQYNAPIGDYLSSTKKPVGYTDPVKASNNYSFVNPATVAWEDGSNKLEKIITQKWIANYPIGMEGWSDFRRTGYPQLITAADNLSNSGSIGSIDSKRMVRRLPYPMSEISNNQYVQDAIATMLGGPDTGATDLWWAKKQ